LRAPLEAELDNFRAVLAWCQEEADANSDSDAAEAGLRLAAALVWFWFSRGYLIEGLQWLEGALARGSKLPAALRAYALHGAAGLCHTRGDRQDRWRTLLKAARREYQNVLALARREGDRLSIARALLWLAEVTAEDDDPDTAWSLCVEARPLFAELGDPIGLAGTLEWLARIAWGSGDRRAALPLLEERLALCREFGGPYPLIHALGAMGHVMRDEGDFARARSLYEESLVLRWQVGDQMALAQSLEDFAVLAGREQQAERAIRLLGAGEALCETLGARPPVTDQIEYERIVAEGRAALGEPAFTAAWAEGRALSLDRAIEYALGDP
jgi:non-specific serine/threonine protein kinase